MTDESKVQLRFFVYTEIDKVLISVVTSSSDQQLQLSFIYFLRTLIPIRHVGDEWEEMKRGI